MRFSRQEYWSGLPFPSPGDLPNPRIEPGSPALQADSLPTELPGKPVKLFSHVQLFVIPWNEAYQARPSMEFSRQEYWSELPFPSPGNLPDLGIEPRSPELQADSLPSEPPGKPSLFVYVVIMLLIYWCAQYNLNDPQNHSSYNWKFVFFDQHLPNVLYSPNPWQPQFSSFRVFRSHIWVRSYSICLSLSGLFSLSMMSSRFIHCRLLARFPCFLWLNYIYTYICIYLIHVYMPLTLFLSSHPWTDTGCFRVSAIVKSAAVNTGEQYLFEIQILFLSDEYTHWGFPDHVIVLSILLCTPPVWQ